MRWTTYRAANLSDQTDRVGLVVDDRIYGLEPTTRLLDLLGDDGEMLARAAETARRMPAEVRKLCDARLRPPIPNPPAIRDFSSFVEHYRTAMTAIGKPFDDDWYEKPVFYFSNPTCLRGDGEDVRIPGNTSRMDYELEVCAVIGREGIDLSPETAEEHIAGYSIFNDWSARDIQADEMARAPIGPAKGKDSANSLGPFLVTVDELDDRRSGCGFDLWMRAYVNGRKYSEGNWATIYWSLGEMIAYASRNARLVPGDIVAVGTVGTGCILELASAHGADRFPWLDEGDEVTLEVERLGRLRNRVVRGPVPRPLR